MLPARVQVRLAASAHQTICASAAPRLLGRKNRSAGIAPTHRPRKGHVALRRLRARVTAARARRTRRTSQPPRWPCPLSGTRRLSRGHTSNAPRAARRSARAPPCAFSIALVPPRARGLGRPIERALTPPPSPPPPAGWPAASGSTAPCPPFARARPPRATSSPAPPSPSPSSSSARVRLADPRHRLLSEHSARLPLPRRPTPSGR